MKCPKCGSENVIAVPVTETEVNERTKGFGGIKACIGWILFSFPGILCGLCGMGKSKITTVTRTKMVNICQDCQKEF